MKRVFSISEYGARSDGITDNTKAIQKAIDDCAEAGGGTVVVPAGGTYKSGTIILKSNVHLILENGSVLLAGNEDRDYPEGIRSDTISGGRVKEHELPTKAFIFAFEANNLTISGGGVIDGNGRAFVEEDLGHIYRMKGEKQYLERPFTLFLIGCTNLTIRDITIRDAAFWTLRLTGCEDAAIHGIRIRNDLKLPNNDGIDIDRCRNVRISDCLVVAGDDAICLKACRGAEHYGKTENISVTGCTLMSTSAALKIGNECRADIRNVVFDACVIESSHRGLSIHLGESGTVENVIFSNIIIETRLFHDKWWGRGEPIFVSAFPWTEQHELGRIKKIRFSNILARSENGVFIRGWRPGFIEDIAFDNVRIELDKWSSVPGGRHDIRPCPGDGMEEEAFSGFNIRAATAVAIRRSCVFWGKTRPDYFRHALTYRDAPGLVLDEFYGESAFPDRFPAISGDGSASI